MMYPNNITTVHIELTDKCQASCPMCLRNDFGGKDRDFIQNVEITFEQFKQWFPIDFIKGLTNFYACGSLGDPVVAKDCLKIDLNQNFVLFFDLFDLLLDLKFLC